MSLHDRTNSGRLDHIEREPQGLSLPRSTNIPRPASPSRARYRLLVIGSLLHASFFILMGTSIGFEFVLMGYFTSSLGKAFLNGGLQNYVSLFLRCSNPVLPGTMCATPSQFAHVTDYQVLDSFSRNAYIASCPKRPLGQLYACNGKAIFILHACCGTHH